MLRSDTVMDNNNNKVFEKKRIFERAVDPIFVLCVDI